MSTLEATVEELKSLPPAKLEEVAGYIHKLKVAGSQARSRALERSFACLTPAKADELEHAISNHCERIDPSQW